MQGENRLRGRAIMSHAMIIWWIHFHEDILEIYITFTAQVKCGIQASTSLKVPPWSFLVISLCYKITQIIYHCIGL